MAFLRANDSMEYGGPASYNADELGIGMPVVYDVMIKIGGKESFVWSVSVDMIT